MANRHMATARTHNRIHTRRKGGPGLTPAQRAAKADSIHNRGEGGAPMNPEEQKRQATLRVEMERLALASAEEFSAMRQSILHQQAQVATLHRQVRVLENRLAEETAHRITGDNLEREGRFKLQDRFDADHRSLSETLRAFCHRSFPRRWGWLLRGR